MKKETKTPKKPYSTPVLSVYGSMTDIVQTIGRKGDMDGGRGMGVNKTQAMR